MRHLAPRANMAPMMPASGIRSVVRPRWLVLQVSEYSTQEVSSPWDDEARAWEKAASRAGEDHERYTVVRVICRVMVGPDDDSPEEYPSPGRAVFGESGLAWTADGTKWTRVHGECPS